MVNTVDSPQAEHIPEFQKALDAVLEIEPLFQDVVKGHKFSSFLTTTELPGSFQYLVLSVISQQVSGHAAKSISTKFIALFENNEFPSPAQVLEKDVDTLKTGGLSTRKAEYIRGLAEAYEAGELSDEKLRNATDDEVVDMIVSIRGFGPWTAQMFLQFWLKRMDVFSPGDIGIQRGFKRYLGMRPDLAAKAKAKPKPSDPVKDVTVIAGPGKSAKARKKEKLPPELVNMEAIASMFSPHRTALQMILWKLSEIVMDTVTGESFAKPTKRSAEGTNSEPSKPKRTRRSGPKLTEQ